MANDSPFAIAHAARLEAERDIRHVLSGEAGEIVLLKRDSSTNAPVELLTVDQYGFSFKDEDAKGNRLPPNVLFELQVPEDAIEAEEVRQTIAIQHGAQVYSIVGPSPFKPAGFQRFWRFWLAPTEEYEV